MLTFVGACYSNAIADLTSLGMEVLPLPSCPLLAPPVQSHADLLLHLLGEKEIVLLPYAPALCAFLRQRGFLVRESQMQIAAQYPHDIALNCFVMDKTLFCKANSTDPLILEYCQKKGITVCDVNQGYCRCTALPLSDHALITADPCVYRAASQAGKAVLYLAQDERIRLNGYPYGFIGGCGGMLSSTLLYLTGDLYAHPQGRQVASFVHAQGIEIVCGREACLVDIGSVIVSSHFPNRNCIK